MLSSCAMEDYLDETCLFAICALMLAVPVGGPFAIAGFLGALIMVCAGCARTAVRWALLLAFLACACMHPAFFAFLPVAAYRAMREGPWAMKLCWLVPLTAQGISANANMAWLQAAGLCVVACGLAVRASRMASERRGLTRAYDSLRERMFAQASEDAPDAVVESQEPALFEGLTQREIAVAQLVAEGMDNREISQRLFLSEGTVRNHISAILAKKDLTNRTQIAVHYYRT